MRAEKARGLSIDELSIELGASASGLSSLEAQTRLQSLGPNEILEKKLHPIRKFLGYFWGPIPWMIEIAVILSAFLSLWDDFAIIFVLLIMNGAVGF